VNLILFEPNEIGAPIARNDRRAIHLVDVLHRKPGDTFDAGVINGARGKGTLVTITDRGLTIDFCLSEPPLPAPPITLLIGLPRPQTARDVLRDATSLGVEAIHFVLTDKGDSNYARSRLWSTTEWRRHLIHGAEQAFCTQLPVVSFGRMLKETLLDASTTGTRLALDNYEAPSALNQTTALLPPVIVAIGSERGWSAAERVQLREHGFGFVHLGNRVLRTETACVAAIVLVRAKLGLS